MSSPLFAQANIALRGLQFVFSLIALSTIAAGFTSVSAYYLGMTLSTALGSSATTFGMLMTYTTMLYGLAYLLAVEIYHYVPRPSLQVDRIVDGVLAVILFIAGIVLATSDYVHHCDLFGETLKCGNLTAGTVFTFLAMGAFLATFGINFLGASAANTANGDLVVHVDHVPEATPYHVEATPTTDPLSPIGTGNSPAAKV